MVTWTSKHVARYLCRLIKEFWLHNPTSLIRIYKNNTKYSCILGKTTYLTHFTFADGVSGFYYSKYKQNKPRRFRGSCIIWYNCCNCQQYKVKVFTIKKLRFIFVSRCVNASQDPDPPLTTSVCNLMPLQGNIIFPLNLNQEFWWTNFSKFVQVIYFVCKV